MLVLLTRVLLWATLGLLVWYILTKIIPRKYLTWFGGVIVLTLIVSSFLDPNNETIEIIWQLISLPLTPLGASIILIGSALSEGVGKINDRKGWQIAWALGLLLLTSSPIFARFVVDQSESELQEAFIARSAQCADVCPADVLPARIGLTSAIVVMGDDASNEKGIVAFQNANDQAYNSKLVPSLIYASELYDEVRQFGATPFVIVTADPGGDSTESETKRNNIRTVLINNGVRADDIRFESTGLNVHRTAEEVEDFLEERRIIADRGDREDDDDKRDDPRIMLVAPALTMPRTAFTFEKMDMQVIARPTDFYSVNPRSSGDNFSRIPDIIPSVDALQLTSRYWDEVLTSTYYFLQGWLPDFKLGWDPNIEI